MRSTPPQERPTDFLPSPEVLEAYNRVLDGSAAAIIEMLHKEQQHRHQMEERLASIQQFGMAFGQVLAFIVAVTMVIGTVVLGLNGKVELAALVITIGIAALSFAYVKGRQVMMTVQKRARQAAGTQQQEDTVRPLRIGGGASRGRNIPL